MQTGTGWKRGLIGLAAALIAVSPVGVCDVAAQVQVGPSKVHRSVMEIVESKPVDIGKKPASEKATEGDVVEEGTRPRLTLKELNAAYKRGDWDKAHAEALLVLGALGEKDAERAPLRCGTNPTPACLDDHLGNHLDVTRIPLNLLWQTTGTDGKPAIAQLLVAARMRPEHRKELPGLAGEGRPLRDVFVNTFNSDTGQDDPTRFFSWYTSTERPSAALAQLPDFIARIPLLGFISKAGATIFGKSARELATADVAKAKKRSWIAVTVNFFHLPDDSADLTSQYALWAPKSSHQLIAAAKESSASARVREALWSPCGQAVVSEIEAKVTAALEEDICSKSPAPPEEKCIVPTDKDGLYTLTAENAACVEKVEAAIDKGYLTAIEQRCECHERPAGEAVAVRAVEQGFKSVVTAASAIRSETTLTNVPYVRHSFGLMTGLMIGRSTLADETPRVKLDSGNIVEDALDRQVTTAIVNFHPWAYRGTTRKMTGGERVRLFGGAVLSPDFGFTGGAGLGIVRGLALNLGGAYLLSDTLRPNDALGAAPKDRRNPFKTKGHFLPVIGLSYVFK